MRKYLLLATLLISLNGLCQNTLKPRTVNYYLTALKTEMTNNLKANDALGSDSKLKAEYFEVKNGKKNLTEEGVKLYSDAKVKAHKTLFRSWNYMQHLSKGDFVYTLYFSIAGFEDLEWMIVRWKKDQWKNQETITRKALKQIQEDIASGKCIDDYNYAPIVYNYDEGPSNFDPVNLIIKDQYLVLERGHLFHSLYNIETESLLINEASPWHVSKAQTKEELNNWIKTNLHSKIDRIINTQK